MTPQRQIRRWVVGLVVIAMAVATAAAQQTAASSSVPPDSPAGTTRAVAGSLLVTVNQPETMPATLERVTRRIPEAAGATLQLSARTALVRVTPEAEERAAAALRDLPDVSAVEPDHLLHVDRNPDDPYFPKQWAHQRTDTPAAWDTTTGSDRVLVAVIDTGMHGGHPDLRGNIAGQVDVSTGSPSGPARVGIDNDSCDLGHGTWVGGVVGAVGDNSADIAGVSWQIDLLDIATNSTRAGASCDGTPLSAVIAGIDYATSDTTRPADVINLSLGAYLDRCPTALQAAIDDAHNAGAVVVASAGNGQAEPDTAGATAYPAGCDRAISVGATDRNDRRAGYSQVNDTIDLVAPGGDYDVGGLDGLIVTTHHAFEINRLTLVQGTSFAAPYVAGVAALMRDVQPLSGPGEIARVLAETARDLGPTGRDDAYGHGLVQTDAAVAAALDAQPEAPTVNDPTSPSPSPSPKPSDEAEPAPPDPSVQRIDAGSPSRPIPTAVAVSRKVFPDAAADHVVLARSDVFADALAGSTLAYGAGPLLFTPSSGSLAAATSREIQRVLPDEATVYLLGGTQALPASLERELSDLGYRPHRLAGATREGTAVAVAEEARRRIPQLGGTNPPSVVLATRGNWPDAVAAGSLGSTFGIPIILTPTDRLDAAARRFLQQAGPTTIYVAGGTVAISDITAGAAADAADARTVRLAGATRIGTAIEIARAYDRIYRTAAGATPRFATAVNIYRDDAWSYILAASALAGRSTSVFIPTEGTDGHAIPPEATDYLRERYHDDDRVLGTIIGANDVVGDETARQLEDLLNGP